MHSQQIFSLQEQYTADTYTRFPVAIESGKGTYCTDCDGKTYLDFTSGIGVNALGFCDEGWMRAVCKQAGKLSHTSNLFSHPTGALLAEILCTRSGMKKVFFANSGAESNEGAIKCARKYSLDRYGEGRHTIVTLNNSFHGRTVTTLSATGQEVFHKNFAPFTEGFVFADANDLAGTLAKLTPDVCAVMIELVQGEGGVLPLQEAYVKALAQECQSRDILLLVDEVQTGIGRTGKLFCYEHYGILPDIVTLAKGLGGGLPMGAVLFGEKTASTLGRGDHATTFGANPVCCAGALAVLETMDDAFLDEVTRKGEYLRERVLRLEGVTGISGKGLMLGIDIEYPVSDVIAACREHGLLILAAKSRLRMLPPLNISFSEIDEGIAALAKALSGQKA